MSPVMDMNVGTGRVISQTRIESWRAIGLAKRSPEHNQLWKIVSEGARRYIIDGVDALTRSPSPAAPPHFTSTLDVC